MKENFDSGVRHEIEGTWWKKKGGRKWSKVGRLLPTHFDDLTTLGHLVSPTVMQ